MPRERSGPRAETGRGNSADSAAGLSSIATDEINCTNTERLEIVFSDRGPHPLLWSRLVDPFRQLWKFRELVLAWARREIQVRYKQSLLGGAWAVLQPFSLMVLFSIVFTWVVHVPTEGVPYPIFSYCALLPWTFLSTSISFGSTSLIQNMNLVTKIYFPREILPLGAIAAALLDLMVASVVFVGLMVFYGIPVYWTLVWVPLLLLIQILLTTGLTLFAAATMVFYRDVRFVIPLALQLWMYASPIIYPLALVPEGIRPLYMLNPMAVLIDSYRRAILFGQGPDPISLGVAAGISVAVSCLGYWFFKRMEWQFADVI